MPMEMIVIEIAGLCNANCPFCPTGRKSTLPGKLMSVDLFKKTFQRLKKLNLIGSNTILCLYNWGEPFLNPELNEILEYCNDKKVLTHISTNASVYKKLSDKACKAITYLSISMPGLTQKAYDRIHGFDLEKIKENISMLTDDIKKSNPNTYIELKQHLYQWNLDDIEKLNDFAQKLNVKIFPYYAYVAHFDLLQAYKEKTLDEKETKEINENIFVHYLEPEKRNPNFKCPQIDKILSLDEFANVLVCCNLTKNCKNYILFNLFDEDAKEKLNSRQMVEECKFCIDSGLAECSNNPFVPDFAKDIIHKTAISNTCCLQIRKETKWQRLLRHIGF